jgi:PPOX class probable F420-dependent enzyme
MELTSHLTPEARERVEARLRHNLMAWLTTVRADGQPVSVPVWFLLREDETFLVYSQAGKAKLRNIVGNPKVSLTLDVTDIGRNIVRIEGTAMQDLDQPTADKEPGYLAKYTERIAAEFGSLERFTELFTAALVVTPTRLRIGL